MSNGRLHRVVSVLLNAELTLESIPEPDVGIDRIVRFAATFDGYRH